MVGGIKSLLELGRVFVLSLFDSFDKVKVCKSGEAFALSDLKVLLNFVDEIRDKFSGANDLGGDNLGRNGLDDDDLRSNELD